MTGNADYSVQGGIEVSGLTPVTHAADEQKNRNRNRRRKKRRAKGAGKPGGDTRPKGQEDGEQTPPAEGDEDRPTIDYLA